jgi:hypothetical protein
LPLFPVRFRSHGRAERQRKELRDLNKRMERARSETTRLNDLIAKNSALKGELQEEHLSLRINLAAELKVGEVAETWGWGPSPWGPIVHVK